MVFFLGESNIESRDTLCLSILSPRAGIHMTTKDIKTIILKAVFTVPKFTLAKWQKLFQTHPDGHSVAVSTISGWKNGKQEMSFYYRNIFIRILCDIPELQEYQLGIRNAVLQAIGIGPHQKLYCELEIKDYEAFLKCVLNELPVKLAEGTNHTWKDISLPVLLEACAAKAEKLPAQTFAETAIAAENLWLTCLDDAAGRYKVAIAFWFQDISLQEIEERCAAFRQENPEYTMGYIFVTNDIPDELSLKVLEQHRIVFSKVDKPDISKEQESAAADNACLETAMLTEALADVILQRVRELNRIYRGFLRLVG